MPDERAQFRILYRRFLLRFLDLEVLAAHGEMHNLLSQIAAVLAALSFVLMLFKVPQYYFASQKYTAAQISVAAWGDQEFLISTTMAVIGIFTILMWDSLFPDRRDCLVLGPLPVRMRTIFRAKTAAIAAALGLTLLSVNVFTGITYPFLASPENAGLFGIIRSFIAYWATMLAAGAFLFFALLALQGVAIHLLSHRGFLRLSGYLQMASFFTVLSVYFLMPPLANQRALVAPGNQLLLKAIPSFWFLGLYQELNGTARPEFAWLAERAVAALLIGAAVAITTYVLAYARHIRRIVEQAGVVPQDRGKTANPAVRLFAKAAFPRPFDRALFLFITRTLARSRQHRMILAIYGGIGLSIALVYLRELFYRHDAAGWHAPGMPLLGAGSVVLFFAVVGLRICFSLPTELRANWIFRITETADINVYAGAVRKALLVLVPVPLWIAGAILFFTLWPWRAATGHLILQAVASVLIVTVALKGFRKIPFTCSYLPGKANLKVTLGAYGILILALADQGIRIELVSLVTVRRYLILLSLLLLAVLWASRRAARAIAPPCDHLLFEEAPDLEVNALDLHSDSSRRAGREALRGSPAPASPAAL